MDRFSRFFQHRCGELQNYPVWLSAISVHSLSSLFY
nr:MAG TPA: Learning-associated protein [Caudoviricetes sp.]